MSRAPDPGVAGRILDAAETCFSRYGFRKATVEDIAAGAQISKGAVYLHFPSKNEVMIALIARNAEAFFEKMVAEAEALPDASARLKFMLEARPLEVWRKTQSMPHSEEAFPLAACPGEAGPGMLPGNIQALQRKYVALLEGILEEGVAAGEFDAQATDGLAPHLNALGYAFMPPYRVIRSRKEMVEHLERFTTLVLHGLRRPDRPGGKRR